MYAILKKGGYNCWLRDGNGEVMLFDSEFLAEDHLKKIQHKYLLELVVQKFYKI